MTCHLTLKEKHLVTPDVHHFVFDRPEGYEFTPGQATEMALDRDGWRDEGRPFTFTGLPDQDALEFVIKSYPDHDGVTEQLGQLQPGDTVRIGDAWGAIEDRGNGLFIAGGAGVTPFIAILKAKLADKGTLSGNRLVFSNKTEADIILRDWFEGLPGLDFRPIVTDQPDSPLHDGMIDRDTLEPLVAGHEGPVYLCGPDPMMEALIPVLKDLGVTGDRLVVESFD